MKEKKPYKTTNTNSTTSISEFTNQLKLNTISEELICHIISFLPLEAMARLATSCRQMCRIIYGTPIELEIPFPQRDGENQIRVVKNKYSEIGKLLNHHKPRVEKLKKLEENRISKCAKSCLNCTNSRWGRFERRTRSSVALGFLGGVSCGAPVACGLNMCLNLNGLSLLFSIFGPTLGGGVMGAALCLTCVKKGIGDEGERTRLISECNEIPPESIVMQR